jgi:hypothetical protein
MKGEIGNAKPTRLSSLRGRFDRGTAEKSGLLKEVAEVLAFTNRNPNPSIGCRECELLDQLADAFDDHTCLPALVIGQFHGGEIPPMTDVEITPYLGTAK